MVKFSVLRARTGKMVTASVNCDQQFLSGNQEKQRIVLFLRHAYNVQFLYVEISLKAIVILVQQTIKQFFRKIVLITVIKNIRLRSLEEFTAESEMTNCR